jgi:hypothetical protein
LEFVFLGCGGVVGWEDDVLVFLGLEPHTPEREEIRSTMLVLVVAIIAPCPNVIQILIVRGRVRLVVGKRHEVAAKGEVGYGGRGACRFVEHVRALDR